MGQTWEELQFNYIKDMHITDTNIGAFLPTSDFISPNPT